MEQEKQLKKILIGTIILFSLFLTFFYSGGKSFPWKYQDYDFLFNIRGEEKPSKDILIINVDEESVKFLQQKWPWERKIFGKVLRNLAALKPKAIGLDFVFTEPGKPQDDLAFFKALEETLQEVPVTLGMNFYTSVGKTVLKKDETVVLQKGVEKPGFPGKAGFINISVDDDNVIRQSDLVEEYRGKYYYSFALRIAESTRNTRLESAEYRPGKFLKIKGLGEIPLYGKNSMLINYSGTQGSFYELSFFQVYQNQVPASLIKDKIVLIGPTLTGINDYHLTPFRKGQGVERYMAGIEIHAHILNTLLNQNWVHFLNPLFQLAFLFFLSIVQVAVFWLYNSYKKLLFTWLGELVLYYSIAFILYLEFSTVVYLIFPGIVLTVLYLFLIFISQLMTLYEQKQMMGKLKSEIEKMQLSFEKIPENFFRDHEISKREEEIISLILENHTNKQIGKKLFISESTVKKHIYNIFQKLGINKRSELLEVLSENLSRN